MGMHDPTLAELDHDYQLTMTRFDHAGVAQRYAVKKHAPDWRNTRELELIRSTLSALPAGSHVLDLPSGTGRIAMALARDGFQVTAADSSAHMLSVAQQQSHRQGIDGIRFSACDILKSGFADDAFDAVLCNRLLHHYRKPEVRSAVLAELRRISRGPVIAFYFLRTSSSWLSYDARNWIRGKHPEDRIPVAKAQLEAEANAAGLKIERIDWVRPMLSPQCYVTFQPIAK
ncbi:class I SAM-dependent methyltransferase [Thiosocius teredinicola]|uniref:class I SAM-dependent methyltransferase n=1 Tax=Thiosocius teredinicola TaxID=1973002 RepID=UPI00099100AA